MTVDRVPGGSLAHLLRWRLDEDPGRGFLHVEDDGPWTFAQLAAASVTLGRRLGVVGRDEVATTVDRVNVAGRAGPTGFLERVGPRGSAAGTAAHEPSASPTTGVRPGDRVIVRVGNDERFLPAAAAVWCRGAAVVAMHPAAPAGEVARVVAAMGVRVVVGDPDDPASAVAPFVAFGRFPAQDAPDTARLATAYAPPSTDVGAEAALVLLTSGSTGEPKGVVLTHDNAWSNLRATVSAFRGDTAPTSLAPAGKPPNLIANPLSHTAGVVRLLFALYVGRSVALLRKFDGRTTKRLLDRHGIDNLTINPAMLRILLDSLEPGEDLGRVRYVSSGTAPLTPALREEFEARFGVPVLQAYGQTEAFGGISIESARDVLAGRRRPGSVGRPLPGVELRLVTSDGADAAPGAEGEIRVRSRSATSGYVGAGASSPLDADGWLRTGDIGTLDEDGYLYLTGRLKNIIICGGFNVVPEEVEAALGADPAVRDAVVLGIPDDRLGEIPVALVESGADADDVLAAVSPRLTPYKRPRRVFVVDALPRVPNGKVDRPRALALARSLAGEPTGAPA